MKANSKLIIIFIRPYKMVKKSVDLKKIHHGYYSQLLTHSEFKITLKINPLDFMVRDKIHFIYCI